MEEVVVKVALAMDKVTTIVVPINIYEKVFMFLMETVIIMLYQTASTWKVRELMLLR